MPNPYLGPEHDLAQRLKALEAAVAALSTQPILLNASTGSGTGSPGLSTNAAGLHVWNSAGTELITLSSADGSGTFNGNVNIGGNLTTSGNTTIAGNLSVVGGISNDNLTSPIVPQAVHNHATNFALNTTNTLLISQSVSVPSGYSKALVTVTVNVVALNKNTGYDSVYCTPYINGVAPNGYQGQLQIASNVQGSCSRTATASLTGLSGSFQLTGYGSTALANWAADSNNTANLDAIIMFYK